MLKGNPKGVVITHANIVNSLNSFLYILMKMKITDKDMYIGYLPLAHVAERLIYFGLFFLGGRIGIFSSADKK